MAEESNYINFNFVSLQQFKKAFIKATKESKTVFTFEGNEFDSGYAKYLIEYLEAHFGKEK
jgi:hypothetical protein